jgi:hypothetical protein
VHTTFWSQNLKKRDHLQDLGIDERIILNKMLEKYVVKICNMARNLQVPEKQEIS